MVCKVTTACSPVVVGRVVGILANSFFKLLGVEYNGVFAYPTFVFHQDGLAH